MTQQTTAPSATQKPIQTLQELAQNLRSDIYYFVSPFGLGDTYYLCAFKHELEKKWQGKIFFVIQPSHEAVCECFANVNYIICKDTRYNGTINYLKLPQWSNIPKLGKLYPAHPIPLGILASLKYNNMTDLYIKFLNIPNDSAMQKPNNMPILCTKLKENIESIAPLDKIIFYLPEVQSMPSLPFFIYKNECEKLQKQGYTIIVNITKKPQYLNVSHIYNLNLSSREAVALALVCARVISMRSGFCDVIALHCKKLKVYYPNKASMISNSLKHINLSCVAQEICLESTFDFIESLNQHLPLKLYKRYTTKGFFRKLRTPFTLYFKIYLRHTNTSQGTMDNQMREFIENELAKTYEYQLGLALQRACERFWYGGFLAFPFAYAKIRTQKGKTLMRMDSIV